jgi:hypothetical protein
MKRTFPSIFLFFPASLILLFFVSCGPAVLVDIRTPTPGPPFDILGTPILETPTPNCAFEDWPCPSDSLTLTAEMRPTLDAMLSGTPDCTWPCPSDSLTMTAEMRPTLDAMMTDASDSLTMTAEMALPLDADSLTLTAVMASTLAAIPSSTSPPWATIIPSVGDLGWGSVYGVIRDGVTNLPLEGASISCVHSSYTSPYLCNGITTTNSDGIYSFTGVFFHDTDRITLVVEMSGYTPLRFEQDFFTRPEFHADLGLFPEAGGTLTPTPYIVCTAPACSDGVLTCGSPDGCLGGCGTVCIPASPTSYPMCTPPVCTNGVLACGNPSGCMGGCGTICLPWTSTPQ